MLGVTLAISGNLLIAFSLVLQKHVHVLREEEKFDTWAGSVDFLFALAMTGLILGEAGNFAAFGLASPTVVSPLGAVAVLANALLSTIFLNETFLLWNLVGLCLVILGSVGVVSAAPPTQAPLTVADLSDALHQPAAISYLLLLTLAVAILLVIEPLGKPTTYGERWLIVNVLLCSLLGSVTVLCSSAISSFAGQVTAASLCSGLPRLAASSLGWLPLLASLALTTLETSTSGNAWRSERPHLLAPPVAAAATARLLRLHAATPPRQGDALSSVLKGMRTISITSSSLSMNPRRRFSLPALASTLLLSLKCFFPCHLQLYRCRSCPPIMSPSHSAPLPVPVWSFATSHTSHPLVPSYSHSDAPSHSLVSTC